MIDLADHSPLAFDFQQVEEIGEAKTGYVVGIDACAGRR